MAQSAGVPFLAAIPMDPIVRIGGDRGAPVVISAPDSAAARALRGLAESIAASLSVAALQADGGVTINMVG
jgi:ATP-binding protein involved in chromosome partitioning